MWDIPVLLLIYLLLTYLFPKRTVQRTDEQRDEIPPNKIRKKGNASPESQEEKAKVKQIEKESPEVKKKRGKVDLLEYEVLREHRVEMVDMLVPEKIIPHLKENKVIDRDEVEQIEKKCKDLRRKGAETMLDILYNSGSWAFIKLIAALQQAGYQAMAQKLTKDLEKKTTDPQSATTTKQKGRLSDDEYAVLRDNHERLVTELDSRVLKNHLFQNDLINEDEMEKIRKKEEELRKDGAEEMLDVIYKSGANAFPKLLKSLDQAGYDKLSSKLNSDLKQKKKKTAKHGLKTIDLNSLEFPDYPIFPQLETIQGDNIISSWKKYITEWKEDNSGKLWCVAMNQWFKHPKFKSTEEFEMVVNVWLSKLEEVVNRGCLEIDKINGIIDVTEALLDDDNDSIFHLNDMFIFMNIIKDIVPDCTNKKDIEEFVQTQKIEKHRLLEQQFEKLKNNLEGMIVFMNIIKEIVPDCTNKKDIEEVVKTKKIEKRRLLEQQRQVFEKLKHNLEGIISRKQNFDLLHIDTESCELADQFHSVVNDVRDIWNKLHVH